MKILGFIVLLCLTPPLLQSQNLIANGDFEDINTCHQYQKACSPKAWRSTSLKLFGYLNDKATDSKYISLLLFDLNRKNDRKFAQTQLLCPLKKGQTYTIKMQVKPDRFWIQKIGIAFSDSLFFTKKLAFDQAPKAQVSLSIPPNIQEDQWLVLEQSFIATGKERFLLLGNFLDDEHSISKPIDQKKYNKSLKRYAPKKRIQYGFDKVQLIANDSIAPCDLLASQAIIYQDSIRHAAHQIVPKKTETISPQIVQIEIPSPQAPPPPPPKIILHNLEFESNQWQLSQNSTALLHPALQHLQSNPSLKIYITGFTDAIGSEKNNLTLSLKRATAVKAYLASQNIAANRMIVLGKGESDPISDNDSAQGRQLNRRVEIEFIQ